MFVDSSAAMQEFVPEMLERSAEDVALGLIKTLLFIKHWKAVSQGY